MALGSTTLSRDDYCSPAVFAAERERLFIGGWFYACHARALPRRHRRVVDVGGESVIITRDADGLLHAHANVCRHRGSRLCEAADGGEPTPGAIRCPYHSWTYSLDGSLRATPRVEDTFDRSTIRLWGHHVAVWNGLIFVSLADAPTPFAEWLADHTPDLATFDALRIEALAVGARTETVVRANWKIIVENYLECLHCAVVHPELVQIVPLYSTGHVVDPERSDGAVELAAGANSFTIDGKSRLSVLPGTAPHEANVYRGCAVFPNVLLDVTGTSASLTSLFPINPSTTVVVSEYLFAADDVASDGFDPAPVVDFNELVGRQDYEVCERVQRGVASQAFTTGILTEKDRFVADFIAHYRATFFCDTVSIDNQGDNK
ncbi:MAG TPA: aromatic ring-hydroxylating dioxygenase subunit alpha [Ilumatobacter sp.]|jgi:Rieske 2Fe-2S family protein|nr:aromatic ring-hydroxylating dioxygenase subunit alpha [Ilumatobacter sp.]